MTPDSGTYIHGTHPDEQERLSKLNELLNIRSLQALDLRGGEVILDVGSGLGQLSRAMARAIGPEGKVIAVERDPDQLAEARRQAAENGEADLVDFRRGDAFHLPLNDTERGAFDIVHTRFVLEHVPDPQGVVDAMVTAARPGGRIVLEDDDHDVLRLWPAVPAFEHLWRVYFESYRDLGNDPIIGRRLIEMLHRAGAAPTRNDTLFFGSCSGHPDFSHFVANFIGVVESAADRMRASGAVSTRELIDGTEAMEAWTRRRDAALWYHTCWAEGCRRA